MEVVTALETNLLTKKRFIETEPLSKAGEKGELKVWEAVKRAYSDKECLGYWRYPLFSKVGETRKEPDILIADQEYGIVVMEVKSFTIHNLLEVNGHRWEYKDFYEDYGMPYQQAEDHVFSILAKFDKEGVLRRKISAKALIALPNITEKEWINHGFDRMPSIPPIIFGDQLGKVTILEKIKQAPDLMKGHTVDEEKWRAIKSVLAGNPVQRKEIAHASKNQETRLGIINLLAEKLYELDMKQEELGKVIPPGPQRIRGIAGSGKTVILCQKAAQMYLKHPEWKIALVFFSRSLYDTMVTQVDKWLKYYTDGDVGYDDEVAKNLKIMHAWGAKDRPGFYRYICEVNGKKPLAVNDIKAENIRGLGNQMGYICKNLLEEKPNMAPLFDAVLIDEGQDLMADDYYKFEGKQPFYWLAYEVLNHITEAAENSADKRLIWAYDESQSLDNLTIPTAKELFGNDPKFKTFVSGFHVGGSRRSEIMYRCYRTPGPILTAAHAIGMGLLREEGMLRGITTKDDWQNIGYKVLNGNFRIGEEIELHRPESNSPNLVPHLWKAPVLNFSTYDSIEEKLEALANKIKENIKKDHLKPSKDILIVVLGNDYALREAIAKKLLEKGINFYISPNSKMNVLKTPNFREQNKDKIWEEDAVTISFVNKAKGNEAHMVYVVGAEKVAMHENDIKLRNQLFVGLTRSRGWAELMGVREAGTEKMYREIDHVIASGNTFKFVYQKAPIQTTNEDAEEKEIVLV